MTTLIDKKVAELRAASTIEEHVHDLRMSIWNQRRDLFSSVPDHPVDLLEPGIALRLEGYAIETDPELGEMWEDGRRVRVAGIIYQPDRLVRVAAGLTPQEHRFTAAHELGHAVLHPEMQGLHRDRIVSGPCLRKAKHEREADEFASCFLMPARLVLQRFQQCFGIEFFRLTEDTVFGLGLPGIDSALRRFRCARDVSLAVATATIFMGRPFESMANFFRISPTAMARRLEEVGVVSGDSL